MRLSRLATLGLALAVLTILLDGPVCALTEFRSEDGGFTILLPEVPQQEQVQNKDQKGQDYQQTQYQVDSENGAIVISFQDNPQLVNASLAEANAALEKGRDVLLKLANGPVQIDEPIRLTEKHPGRAFAADIPAMQGHIRARMYLIKGRLYQILVVGTSDFAKSDESTKILESFKLLTDASQ
jgi:hypothetical protein